ncbi:MAG TPA: squalene/phytoene synthase family protein [Longimicrobium sp.]
MIAPLIAPTAAGTLADARDDLSESLGRLLAECPGVPCVDLRGQLIRPLTAHAAARALGCGDDVRAGFGALAVQLAHEASLVHDDIVDGAATRRGEKTLAAAKGVGAALVLGDHLLAWAYRLAARTGSLEFADLFAEAVERTIAGELAQGRATGRVLTPQEYEAIALDKAGALLGCALAAAPAVTGRGDARTFYQLGRSLGVLYQRLDDLLDYCPATDTGKPPLGDYAQQRWTWVLEEVPGAVFGRPVDEIRAALHAPGADGRTPIRRLLARLDAGFDAFARARATHFPGDTLLAALATDWRARAHAAVRREQEARTASSITPRIDVSRHIRQRVPSVLELPEYFSRNSRSFAFAAGFFPPDVARQVARVYAWCRVTDDLVDRTEGESAATLGEVLDEWVALSRRAYRGGSCGVELIDRVMGEMAGAGVPFAYAAELAEGMRMDLRRETYPTPAALRVYTYRVASVVGLWLTELFGVHDAATLQRAAAMGHAMQLTNILRDVGEDARTGRIYLPADLLARHGVTADDLAAMRHGRAPVPPAYGELTEALMRDAEASYALAFEAIPRLPGFFQRPVAVAAYVYRGIHGAIRRNGYDNLRLRARTSAPEKALLAARALWDLRAVRRADRPGTALEPAPLAAGGGLRP